MMMMLFRTTGVTAINGSSSERDAADNGISRKLDTAINRLRSKRDTAINGFGSERDAAINGLVSNDSLLSINGLSSSTSSHCSSSSRVARHLWALLHTRLVP